MTSRLRFCQLLAVGALLVAPLVQSNSLGEPSMCNARHPDLGCSLMNRNSHGEWDAQDCGAGNHNKYMPWTKDPRHAPELFTLEAIDGACEYVPGEFITLNLIQHDRNMLYRGAMLYAVNDTAKDTKVGGWHTPLANGKSKFWTPWADLPGHECGPVLMHSEADVKSFKEVLRFRAPPVGTGSISIRCLLKVDVANSGGFYWPNSEDLVLHEAPQQPQKWILAAAGQSCASACTSISRSCDTVAVGAPADHLLVAIDGIRECRLPLLSSCSAGAPMQDDEKELCFYRGSSCNNRTAKEACSAKPRKGERRLCPCKGGMVRDGIGPAAETEVKGTCASNEWISSLHPKVRPSCCHRKPAVPKMPPGLACKEALVGNTDKFAGASYKGCQTTTVSGEKCQKWTAQEPHRHDWSPVSTPGKGLGDHNYCRNPDDSTTIWCYTSNTTMRWDYCEPFFSKISPEALLLSKALTLEAANGDMRNEASKENKCDETLKYTKDAGYRGCQTKTASGRTCQKWTSQSPHKHSNAPDKDAMKNLFTGLGDHNYCRNPDLKKTIWCHTTDPNMPFEYCHPMGYAAAKPKVTPTVLAHYVGYHGGCRTATDMSPPLLRVVQDVGTLDACKELCAATDNCGALEYCTPKHIGTCRGVCRLLPGPTLQYTWGNGVKGLACYLRMENATKLPIRTAQWSEHAYRYIGSVDQEKFFPKGDFHLASRCIDGDFSNRGWCNLHDNSHERYKSRNKYLMLDFGSPMAVSQVHIFPYVFPSVLQVYRYQVLWPAFELWIGDVPHNPWKNKKCFEGQYYGLKFPYLPYLESVPNSTYDPFVNCKGVGRYIFLVLPGSRMALRLRQIVVYGAAVPASSCTYFNVGRGCAGKRCANLHPQGWGKAKPGSSTFSAAGPFVNGATMTGDVGGPMQCAEGYIASGAALTCGSNAGGMAVASGEICTKCKMEEWNPPETARSVSWERAKFGLRNHMPPDAKYAPQVGFSCSQLDTCAGIVITQDDKTQRDGKHWFQMDAGVTAPIGGVVVQRPSACNHVSEYEVLTSLDGKKWSQTLSSDGKTTFYSIPKIEHNYCRSIGDLKTSNGINRYGIRNTIWCYTTDKKLKWEYCEPLAHPANKTCNETLWGPKGAGYRGCQTKTRTGRTCQKWAKQWPHKHSVYGLTGPDYKSHGLFQNPVFARYVRLTKLKFEGRCMDSNGRFGLISCRSGPVWKKIAASVNSTCTEENNNLIKVDWTVSQQPYDRLQHCQQLCVNQPGCRAIFLPDQWPNPRQGHLDPSGHWVTGCHLFRVCGMELDKTQRDNGDTSPPAPKPWPWVGDTYEMQASDAGN